MNIIEIFTTLFVGNNDHNDTIIIDYNSMLRHYTQPQKILNFRHIYIYTDFMTQSYQQTQINTQTQADSQTQSNTQTYLAFTDIG